ncbi:MAG: SLC13 family permease [Candidatus Omnitrophica bacterium]|nr:SLC13 family permease [Candidatus Omnitrophota bacterium]MCM8803104.1 SLC13 family permease [Candidatus Omnitrophota bacterium]
MKNLTLIIFLITYCGIVIKRDKSLYFIFGAIFLLLILKIIEVSEIPNFINYNVLGIFLGTSILSYLFAYSKVPSHIVDKIVEKKYSTGIIFLLICIITGFISAFVENIATIMIMAPVALEFTKKYKINPIPLFVGMAVSSNLQGCATMVGDSPSIILAMESNLNFNDFFYMPGYKLGLNSGKLGIFFFVQFGAILSFFVLYLFFKKEKVIHQDFWERYKIISFFPTVLLILLIFTLAITSFLKDVFSYFPAVICLAYGFIGIFWLLIKKGEKINIKEIDWHSFFLLIGIFILVGSLKKVGFIEDIANFLLKIGKSEFKIFLMIVWISVFVSAFVDNIPYTMAMISGIKILCKNLGTNPYVFLFGLLIGTCVGGNITPIGASCNVVSVGILRKNGYKVNFFDFVKIGFPFSIISVLGATLLLWFVYK